MLNDIDIRNYRKNGYIILKNIYSTEQVARFRNIIKKEVTKDLGNESRDYQFLEQTHLKDVLSYSGLEEVILNEKLINALNGILDKQAVYWGFSSFRWNEKAYRRFHNDARNDTECPFTTKYPLVRVGVYLQDHSSFSNGLKIWKGSCNTLKYGRTLLKKIIFGKGSLKYLLPQQLYSSINVELEPGDAVIWNLRTCHSGMPIRVKYFQKTSFHPIIENFIEKFFPKLIIKSDVERAVLFSTFGAESKALENFVNYNLVHPETKNTLRNSNFLNNNLIKEKSEKLGLKLIDVLK